MSEEITLTEEKLQVLNTMVHHRLHVQQALQIVVQALERRSLVHDASKFGAAEFEGFARINRVAREYPYGSAEYRDSLKAEKPTIERHYRGNSHHPEYWDAPEHNVGTHMMGLLDLVEMVCDWWAAWKVYDGQRPESDRSTWDQNVEKQRQRFLEPGILSQEQWFVVDQMTFLLGDAPRGINPCGFLRYACDDLTTLARNGCVPPNLLTEASKVCLHRSSIPSVFYTGEVVLDPGNRIHSDLSRCAAITRRADTRRPEGPD